MVETHEILDAVLAICSPSQHAAGQAARAKLLSGDPALRTLPEVARTWNSAFTGLALMANRRSPVHRDSQGRAVWYDLLMSLGPYHRSCLDFPDLGLSLAYPPRTLSLVLGKNIRHAVEGWTGEQLCYAYFMRDKVHACLDIPEHNWPTEDEYWDVLPAEVKATRLEERFRVEELAKVAKRQ